MKRSIMVLGAGLAVMASAGVVAACQARVGHATTSVQQLDRGAHDDGYVQPPATSMQAITPTPSFPDACANDAYCALGTDSICTIILVALNSGTAEDDVVAMLRPVRESIHAGDFTNCPGFEHYWISTTDAEGSHA